MSQTDRASVLTNISKINQYHIFTVDLASENIEVWRMKLLVQQSRKYNLLTYDKCICTGVIANWQQVTIFPNIYQNVLIFLML